MLTFGFAKRVTGFVRALAVSVTSILSRALLFFLGSTTLLLLFPLVLLSDGFGFQFMPFAIDVLKPVDVELVYSAESSLVELRLTQ